MTARAVWLVSALGAVVALGTGAVLLAGPYAGERPESPAATWDRQPCPADVEVEVVPPHTCGWVSAPMGRSTQQVFVVVVEPPRASERGADPRDRDRPRA